jgi:hypothetical protein
VGVCQLHVRPAPFFALLLPLLLLFSAALPCIFAPRAKVVHLHLFCTPSPSSFAAHSCVFFNVLLTPKLVRMSELLLVLLLLVVALLVVVVLASLMVMLALVLPAVKVLRCPPQCTSCIDVLHS